MRYFGCSLLILIVACSLSAQSVTITEAESLRDGDAYQVLGKYNEKTLLYLDQFNDVSIVAYNDDMSEEWRKELDFEVKNPTIIDAVGCPEDFTILYRFWKKGHSHIWARKYNEKAELIDSTKISSINSWTATRSYDVEVSQDRSKVLLYNFNAFNKLELIMFDLLEMKTLWVNEIKLENLSYPRDFFQLIISNDGILYAVFIKDNYRFNRKKTRFVVLKTNGKNIVSTPYPTNQKLIFDAYFKMDNRNKRLTGGGLYDEKRSSRAQGAFYISIDHQNPLEYTYELHDFDVAFIASLDGKKPEKKDTFSEAIVNNMVLRQDGGGIIVIEKFKVFTNGIVGSPFRTTSRAINPQTYTDYNYDDIILVSFNPDGRLDWQGTLPKKQFSQNDNGRYSSYFIFKNKGAIRFLYNDEIKRENSVSEYVLFSNGTNQRKNILNTDDKKIQLRFRDALQVGGSELLVPSQFKRDLRIVRIKYD